MGSEAGDGKPEVESYQAVIIKKPKGMAIILVLRLFAFLATLSGTIIMVLNKQTATVVVGQVGNTLVKAPMSASFNQTPAYVFFVVANAVASLHNLVMLAAYFLRNKFDFNATWQIIIPILDMTAVALVATGASGAAFVGEVAKNGNSQARWNKICDKFGTFCNRAIGAMVASYVGLLLLMLILTIYILKLRNQNL